MAKKCPRCGCDMAAFGMSIFEPVDVCIDCRNLEDAHPEYERAREVERQHCLAGDYNFDGIGLPAGYAMWADAERKKMS